ncbi:unnamed protein product [Cylindrotheca closterium]|uniref:DOMON domain-containing protein n=1 Tax=Cylindrotheca closterium TaxID=2856 RepID=A0AAD2PWH8_9STRA|nr:unnamed protein product [Cylindrotheca closterium]
MGGLNNKSVLLLALLLQLLLGNAPVVATKEVAEAYFDGFVETTEQAGYTDWLNANFGTSYSQHSFLSTSSATGSGAAVFWTINGDEISFAVAARATGWLSFGISEAGGMLGSDVVYYETANPDELVDSYIMEARAAPLKDDCQSWNLIAKTITDDGWMILEVNRKLDTGDTQDHTIKIDAGGFVAPTRLIAAWGDTPTVSFHGTNAARNSVRLFADGSVSVKDALLTQLNSTTVGIFDVRESNYEIPGQDTTYHEVCRTAADILQEIGVTETPLTIIGAMPVISEATRAYIHHFTVYSKEECGVGTYDRSMIYAWAPGDEGWALPDNVGFPLFEVADRQAISIEIHYNNPELVQGELDSSGLRFFYINGEREQRAAILELGDPTVSLFGETISDGLTQYEFSCPSACSSAVLQQQGVTVFGEYLHMHQTGVRMTNDVIRDNEVVHTSKVDVFEFDQQGAFLVQQEPYEVKPGDAFRTSCYYRDGAEFGLSSQEEMCIAYVLYYPAQEAGGFPWMCPYGIGFPICDQQLVPSDLQNNIQALNRVFGTPSDTCAGGGSVDPTDPPTDPTANNSTTLAPTSSTAGRTTGVNTVFFTTLIGAAFLFLTVGL